TQFASLVGFRREQNRPAAAGERADQRCQGASRRPPLVGSLLPALKTCIAKLIKSEEFPDKSFAEKCWTHNLQQLLSLAGIKADLDTALRTDADLQDNWDCVKDWTESSRYDRTTKAKAEQLFDAITDKRHGVLLRLKHHWYRCI